MNKEDFKYIIYKATSPSGKSYIGKTCNLVNRKTRHKNNAKSKMNHPFYDAINKYGWDNFVWEIIALFCDESYCYENEVLLIQKYNTMDRKFGYNYSFGGKGGRSGIKRTENEKKHLSKYWSGKIFSKETKLKISSALTGKKHKDSSKIKMRNAKLGAIPHNKKIYKIIDKRTSIVQIFNGQEELCEFIKIKRTTLQKYLYGKTKPKKNGKLELFLSNYEILSENK